MDCLFSENYLVQHLERSLVVQKSDFVRGIEMVILKEIGWGCWRLGFD